MRIAENKPAIYLKKIWIAAVNGTGGADNQTIKRYLNQFNKSGSEIQVFGFLRSLVFESKGQSVDSLSDENKIEVLEAIWKSKIDTKKVAALAYTLVIAVRPEVVDTAIENGLPLTEYLLQIIGASLQRFQYRFYPGETLGYCVTICPKGKEIQGKVLIFPQTDRGTPIDLSKEVSVQLSDDRISRINFSKYIFEAFQTVGTKAYLDKIQNRPQPIMQPDEYARQDRLLTYIAWSQVRAASPEIGKSSSMMGQKIFNTRDVLNSRPEHEVREYLREAYEKRINDWTTLSTKSGQALLTKAQQNLQIVRGQIRLQAVERRSLTVRIGNMGWLGKMLKNEAFDAPHCELGWHKLRSGGSYFVLSPDLAWWEARMRRDDRLGRAMSEAENALKSQNVSSKGAPEVFGFPSNFLSNRRAQQDVAKRLWLLFRMHAENVSKEMIDERDKKELSTKQLSFYRQLAHLETLDLCDGKGKLLGAAPVYQQQFREWLKSGPMFPVKLITSQVRDNYGGMTRKTTNRERTLHDAVPVKPDDVVMEAARSGFKPDSVAPHSSDDSPRSTESASGELRGISEDGSNLVPKSEQASGNSNPPIRLPAPVVGGEATSIGPVIPIEEESPHAILTKKLDSLVSGDIWIKRHLALRDYLNLPNNLHITRAKVSPRLDPQSEETFSGLNL